MSSNRLHARAGREMPGVVADLALEALKGLMGAKRENDADAKYVRDRLIPIGRGQDWLIYMLCRSLCFDFPAVEGRNRAVCENLIEACIDPPRAETIARFHLATPRSGRRPGGPDLRVRTIETIERTKSATKQSAPFSLIRSRI